MPTSEILHIKNGYEAEWELQNYRQNWMPMLYRPYNYISSII